MDCVDERADQGRNDSPQFQHGVGPSPASLQMAVAAAPAISISGLWGPERVALKEDTLLQARSFWLCYKPLASSWRLQPC